MDLQTGVELRGRAGLEGSEGVPQPRVLMTWCVEHHVSLGMHNTMFNFFCAFERTVLAVCKELQGI